MTDEELNRIIEALKEKALGNIITQTIEQYKNENDCEKLTEKTIKKIINDIDTQACIKLIDIELKRREIEKQQNYFDNLTDEQLAIEKKRLLEELARSQK